MKFFVILKKLSENSTIFFLQNLKIPTLYLGALRVLAGTANRASNCNCSNLCSFWDMTYFMIFRQKFPKTWLNFRFQTLKSLTLYLCFIKKFSGKLTKMFASNFENPNPVVGGYQTTLRGLRTLHAIITARIFLVFEIWRFLWFIKKFSKTWLNFCFQSLKSLTLSGYFQGLQMLPPNLTAQTLVVSEIRSFLWF